MRLFWIQSTRSFSASILHGIGRRFRRKWAWHKWLSFLKFELADSFNCLVEGLDWFFVSFGKRNDFEVVSTQSFRDWCEWTRRKEAIFFSTESQRRVVAVFFFVFNRLESSLIGSSSVFTSVRMKPKSVFGFIFFFALSDPWRFVFFFWCPFRAAKASQLSRPSRPLKATHAPHTHTHNKKKGSRLRNAIRLFVVCLFVCLFVFFGGRRPTRRRRGPFDACEIR